MQDEAGQSQIKTFLHNKWVLITLLADVVIVLLLVLFSIINGRKTAAITFNVTPVDAIIAVNGSKGYENQKTYSMFPGEYRVTISQSQLETKEVMVKLQNDDRVNFAVFLTDKDNGLSFYKERTNLESFEKLSEIASSSKNISYDSDKSAEEFIDRTLKARDFILIELPIEKDIYEDEGSGQRKLEKHILIRAEKGLTCTHLLCITAVTTGIKDKSEITDIIKEKGYNPNDFEINYEMF